ncbi:MAG: cupin domain-containing protein [Candidatus Poribacteria bacterium]|nr:cupin domain-containing protein [Candidatus Poribacteria bacterium]
MKRLIFEDIYSWSVFSEARQIDFNGHLWVRDDGNIAIDPVTMCDADRAQFEELGGAKWIVITNRDHEREAAAFQEWTGAEVIVHEADADLLEIKTARKISDGETIVPGLRAVHLPFGKSPGEIALYFSEKNAILFGDIVAGEPMGRLTLLADEKLADAPKAAMQLRKVLALNFNAVLVGDGHSLFRDGRQELVECLQARSDIYINRINIDEIEWADRNAPHPYEFEYKDIDPLIGAKNIGYCIYRLQPGKASFPMHLHHFGEEMCYVMEGTCTLKTPRGDMEVRQGDFIAFPPGPVGAHKFVNEGDAPVILFILGTATPHDVSEYPDSNKVLPYVLRKIYRKEPSLDYFDGEV